MLKAAQSAIRMGRRSRVRLKCFSLSYYTYLLFIYLSLPLTLSSFAILTTVFIFLVNSSHCHHTNTHPRARNSSRFSCSTLRRKFDAWRQHGIFHLGRVTNPKSRTPADYQSSDLCRPPRGQYIDCVHHLNQDIIMSCWLARRFSP
jgi:hypothetical protein